MNKKIFFVLSMMFLSNLVIVADNKDLTVQNNIATPTETKLSTAVSTENSELQFRTQVRDEIFNTALVAAMGSTILGLLTVGRVSNAMTDSFITVQRASLGIMTSVIVCTLREKLLSDQA